MRVGVANYNSVIRPNYNSVIHPNYNSVIRPKMTIYHQQHFDSPNLYSHRLSDTIYPFQDSRLLIPFNLYDSGLSPNYNNVIRNPRYYNVIPITIVAFELPINNPNNIKDLPVSLIHKINGLQLHKCNSFSQ